MMVDENKALEQLHTDSSHVPGPGMDGRTWLNTADVVDRLLRDFLLEVLKKAEASEGFMPWLEFETRRLNNLFLGVTPSDQYSTGPWNAPDQCGDYILKYLQINGANRTAVRDALTIMVNRILSMAAKSSGFDPQKLDAEIALMRHALLGTLDFAQTTQG